MSGDADGGRREFSRVCNQLTVFRCSRILLGIQEKFKMRLSIARPQLQMIRN